ncbi:hypothetical protein [Botrimarina hoheduenensis]|uniref:hypothetical protein n=1 Tax=Botrimarina hoheduenensis TaxID=2528000 RepID=UPI0018D3AEE0|nr:hypothetical protein [Botrimarina hoheduenensis]
MVLGFLPVLAFSTGCGNGLARLEGQVSLDGEPLRAVDDIRGTVMFQPVGEGAIATAKVDESGRYTVNTGSKHGIMPGDYRVMVKAVRIIPPKDQYSMPSSSMITPAKFAKPDQSNLTVSVEPGSNEYDIAITAK